jgi:hypothetical protein
MTSLDFPAGVPNRCASRADCAQNLPPLVSMGGAFPPGGVQQFEHVALQDVTDANADICFPIDGHQSTT